jgi:molybdopterin-guanine dinucleotide biosynthesis protein A
MGQDKSLLPHPSGGSFVSHAISRLTGLCDHVIVSGGSPGNVQADFLQDARPYQGPVIGIATAVSFAGKNAFDACLVTPVDMPFLTKQDLTCIRDAWEQEWKLCCAVSADDGRLQPLVAVYPISFEAALQGLVDSEDRSLTRWIRKQDALMVNISAESSRNINTPEDLAE